MLTMLLIRLPAGSAFMRRKRSSWVWNGEITQGVYSRRSAEVLQSTNWSVRGILHDSDHCGPPGTKEVGCFFLTPHCLWCVCSVSWWRWERSLWSLESTCATVKLSLKRPGRRPPSPDENTCKTKRNVINLQKRRHFKFSFEQNKCHYYFPFNPMELKNNNNLFLPEHCDHLALFGLYLNTTSVLYLHSFCLLTLSFQQQVSILSYTPASHLDQGLLRTQRNSTCTSLGDTQEKQKILTFFY